MMPHSLGGQGHAGHEAKRVNEILALEGAVQLAILNAPTLECGELRRDLLVGQLLDAHGEPPQFIVAPACRWQFSRSGGVPPDYPAGYRKPKHCRASRCSRQGPPTSGVHDVEVGTARE